MSDEGREVELQHEVGDGGPWVLFSIDHSWVAVAMDKVSAVFDSAAVALSAGDSKIAYAQSERQGIIWCCDGDLRPRQGEPRAKILWFEAASGPFGLFCDEADDVAAGALVSTHELPPILGDEEGLLAGLLVPDKRRIATLCDVDGLADYLHREEGGEHG